MDQAKLSFLTEAKELLQEMEQALLELEDNPGEADLINAIFRAAHTIKGTSGIFGFDEVERFTHVVENVLDRVRGGQLAISENLIATLLSCQDHISILVELDVDGEALDSETRETGNALLAELEAIVGNPLQKEKPAEERSVEPVPVHENAVSGEWKISVSFNQDVLRSGMDPLSFIRYLKKLGDLKEVRTSFDDMPAAEDMDPESCYLSFSIDLESAVADKQTIEKAFDFVRDDCELDIYPPVTKMWEYIKNINSLPDDVRKIGEILQEAGILTQRELVRALEKQQEGGDLNPRRLGEVLMEEGRVHQPVLEAALEKQQKAKTKTVGARQLKVDADKLDQLINLVGELVIAGARSKLLAQRVSEDNLLESMSVMSRLIEEIRDNTLRLRMVQIGETFSRFTRVVRDVSRELGKNIQLHINGGEAELDKTMVEKISDPLMHLVRNAMDHGVEPEDERITRGKPAKGTLTLNAYHDSGSIVIQVLDDGRGLDRRKIEAKAIEKGLIETGEGLSDQEIYRLIFEPGFSTAEAVTNLSGRGVGMDVVKKNIESLRGTVDVQSSLGQGTTISIRLPLTLAIIDGFLVKVGEGAYVIPLDTVIECIELTEEHREASINNNYINLRGEVLPFLRLRDLFDDDAAVGARENIVVVQYAGQTAGLVVDELLGEFQTVIKPLGKIFERLQGISGSTILGSGEVAVILDVPGLIHRATARSSAEFGHYAENPLRPQPPNTLH